MLIISGGDVKWNFVHGLFENAIYGGRVDNTWDLKVLTAYVNIFFNNDVIGGRKLASGQLTQNITLPTTVNYQVSISIQYLKYTVTITISIKARLF